MEIRTLTGRSIPEALAEAKNLWGDSVVMLQAHPPAGQSAARISVALPAHRQPAGRGPDLLLEETAKEPIPPSSPAPGAMRRTGRKSGTPLFERIRPASEVFTRIDRSGSRVVASKPEDEAGVPSAATSQETPPVVDPGFSRLVRQGLRPSRARRFCRAGSSGQGDLSKTIAQHLPTTMGGRAPKRVAFVGEPGSGKTSLVLRSALSRVRAGRRPPTIVVVAPDRDHLPGWQDPTPMFETFDLEVARCSKEALASALAALDGDVLIDAAAGMNLPRELRLHVRLAVDARNTGPATAREGDGADSVVVTHLDCTKTLGFVAERLMAMNLPVAALVKSSRLDAGLEAYSPLQFARKLCHD